MSNKELLFSMALLAMTFASQAKDYDTDAGQPLSAAEIRQWAITVYPDGRGLPDGQGTAAEGEALYQNQCLACHGPDGDNGIATRLSGLQGYPEGSKDPLRALSVGAWPHATSIFDFIRRAMPHHMPKSLADDQVYALTAYILHLNGRIDKNATMDKTTLPRVTMANSDRTINVWQQEQQHNQ